MADDLGYSEIGAYGQQKIETPSIDLLADEGIKYTQFYSGAPVCAPARSVLLTGLHSGHTPIRGNHEWGERGEVWNFAKAVDDPNLEGQFPLPDSTTTIASILQKNGYATGMIGKWGLGGPLSNSVPTKMGFDYFMGYNCQRQAHTYFPKHLWENESKVLLNNKLVVPGTKLAVGSDSLDINSYSDYNLEEYAPDIMHDAALSFIDQNQNKPFFLYYATPISHAPIQAPDRWVDHYVNKFGDEDPYLADRGYFPVRYPKSTYAGMVSYLDEQVGQLVEKLEQLGILENTIIIFTSDNGPTYNGGTNSEWFDSAKPFLSTYGSGKGFVKEGGIRVPMIVYWPAQIKEKRVNDHISAFQDLLPTIVEAAQIKSDYQSDGISMLPGFLGNEQKKHDYLYWEFPEYGGQQAVRWGKWKGIRSNIKSKKEEMKFELFDLENDIQETQDVSANNPDISDQILKFMEIEHKESPIDRFKLPKIGDSDPTK